MSTLPRLIAAIADEKTRSHVSRALRGAAHVTFVRLPSLLVPIIGDAPPSAILVRLVPGSGHEVTAIVDAIQRRFPFVPAVVMCPMIAAIAGDVVDVARSGISHIAFEGIDDLRCTVLSALERSPMIAACDDAMRALGPILPPSVRPIFGYCLTHVRETPSVDLIAAHLGMHPRALCRRLRHDGLPSPAAVVSWSRLLVGVRLLATHQWSAERVALELGFASASAFRTMLKRHTGVTLSQLRRAGGLEGIMAVFSSRWQLSSRSGISQWGIVRTA